MTFEVENAKKAQGIDIHVNENFSTFTVCFVCQRHNKGDEMRCGSPGGMFPRFLFPLNGFCSFCRFCSEIGTEKRDKTPIGG